MKEKLKLGTAYHSNRILRHVEEDMVAELQTKFVSGTIIVSKKVED